MATRIWHTFPSRGWPMTAVEEEAFVDVLVDLGAQESAACERHHATAILNALRLGVSAEAVLGFLPGLSSSDLLNAYRWLEVQVDAVNDAWTAVFESAGTSDSSQIAESLAEVGKHLPAVPTAVALRAKNLPSYGSTPVALLSQAIREIDGDMLAMHRAADDVEALLSKPTGVMDADKGHEVGLALYHPYSSCLWSAGLYLPRRPGEVVPAMAARLLDVQK
jgi:hypothetical protein